MDIKKGIEGAISKLILVTFLASSMLIFDSLSEGSGAKNKVGPGSDDWWTAYPAQSYVVASEVEHPQWVLDALESKPVVIYVHKGCGYCRPQTEAMAEVIWHSTEEVTGKAWIEEYVQDAASYHNENSGNWKKSEAQRSVFHGSI